VVADEFQCWTAEPGLSALSANVDGPLKLEQELQVTQMTVDTIKTLKFSTEARRFGYAVAVGVNVVLVLVVNNIQQWGLAPWLTDEFGEMLWLINLSLGVSIAVNLAYMAYDEVWFKAATQILVNGIVVVVALVAFQIYPFDFSAYAFNWDLLVRFIIGGAIFGSVIGVITETVKLFRAQSRT